LRKDLYKEKELLIHMKTVKCVECQTPVKQLLSNEDFEGWRRCHNCDELNHVIATQSQEFSKQSLTDMLDKLKQNRTGIQTLQFILDNGTAEEKDILFCVGKQAKTFLDLLHNVDVLEKNSKRYRVKKTFQEPIQEYVEQNIRKKSYNKRKVRNRTRRI